MTSGDRTIVSMESSTALRHGGHRRRRSLKIGVKPQAAVQEQLEAFPPGRWGLLWAREDGLPINRSMPPYFWQQATKGMGLPARSGWHSLRHYNASLLISAGLSARAVADRLGHEDPSVTLATYAHLWPSDEQRAIDAIDDALE